MLNHLFLKIDLWRAKGELDGIEQMKTHLGFEDEIMKQERRYYIGLIDRLERNLETCEPTLNWVDWYVIGGVGGAGLMVWGFT